MTGARAGAFFPARIGAVLVTPVRALAGIESRGGGVRDAGWLVLIGILAFRSRELAGEFLAVTHVPVRDILAFALGTVSREVREAAMIILPAAIAITLFAGRGRRDPNRDVELGAACYVPFFAVRAVLRMIEQRDLSAPLPVTVKNGSFAVAMAWAALIFVFGLRTARRRNARAAGHEAPAVPVPVPPYSNAEIEPADASPPRGFAGRAAMTVIAAVVGVALFHNLIWIVRNAHAIRPLTAGEPASGFTLPRVDGHDGSLSLSDLKGKVVLLDFWATWCPPCKVMIPTLHDLHREWAARGVEFIGIHSPDVPAAEVRRFLSLHPAPYPMVQDDPDGSVARRFKVMALPHFVVLDGQGLVQKVFWGYTARTTLGDALAAAVGDGG